MSFINRNAEKGKVRKNKDETETKLHSFAVMPVNDLFSVLSASLDGLTSQEAEKRLEELGENVIKTGNKNTSLHRLKEAVITPFNLILILIAVITYFTDVVATEYPNYTTVVIIVFLVTVSSMVAFFQSQRSNAAAEKLSKMISNKAEVWRDGTLKEIPISEIVPGDMVKLSAGDMLPSDVRFLTAKDTFVAQSALTGESNPVEKFSDMTGENIEGATDLRNIGFMGSNIISGSATALVLTTGNKTYLGSMAKILSGERANTSFERGVNAVSRLLVHMMLVMVPIVFLINGVSKGQWANSLLFSISIAVGLTPEMLPVIMTSTLAKGAVAMSRRDVIVRNLSAIQTFGEMDILCTDKTGTLTEDKIVLEKYMDLLGEDDNGILCYAYLNSYFQTGLKNLIDLAIINRAVQNGLKDTLLKYTRIDEIPFDFSRRRMSVVLKEQNGRRQLITKGAVEEIMGICSYVEMGGQILQMNEETKSAAMSTYSRYNADGLRMIAVARKDDVPDVGAFGTGDECDMVLIGFVGFLDPPKESAKAAITALKDHGVRTVVLTGDSEGVAVKVCGKVGVNTSRLLTGNDVEAMDDKALIDALKTCDLFAKLSPFQKERVVKAFQSSGHTVGYMGDGINDAPALRQADVGISVDSAVDIAKETADIILLKKDLMVLEQGVVEGRKTFGNIIKYIKMAASGNFGNMISVLAASFFLPFLPMLPVQILAQNLLCDFAQMGIPFDSVDEEYIRKPRKWETASIKSFMAYMGPLSSVFDIICFIVLWKTVGADTLALAPLFQSGWFVFGTVSQVLVIHMIRTSKTPFLQSKPSKPLLLSTTAVAAAAVIVGFSRFSEGIEMLRLPVSYVPGLTLIIVGYFCSAQLMKKVYIKKYGEWL